MAVAIAAFGAPAGAEPREDKPRVAMSFAGCEEALSREAQRIAAIELRAALVETGADLTTTQVTAICRADAADLRVLDPTTSKSVERSVVLSQAAPNARARLLALAVAELVAASWSELENNPEPKAPPAAPRAPVAVREAARGAIAPTPIELAALADAVLLASGDLVWGGGARSEIWLAPAWLMRFDALAHYREIARATGSIALTMPTVSASMGASIGSPTWRGMLTIGARGGYVWMSGVGADPATTGHRQQGPTFGPEIAVEIAAWPRAHVHPFLGISSGVQLVGVNGTVNEGRDIKATGVWGAVSLGAALR